MYCKHCGKEVAQDAVLCIHCGRSLQAVNNTYNNDTGSMGWGVLGFFLPIVGLILYLVWKNEKPNNARIAGKGALIGVIVNVVLSICYVAVIVPALTRIVYYGTFFNPFFPAFN